MKKVVLSLLVNNHYGVTTRVTNLFSRRGFSFESITGGDTERKGISRLTIITEGSDDMVQQICGQLEKLEEVIKVTPIPEERVLIKDFALVKLKFDSEEEQQQILEKTEEYGAKVLKTLTNCIIIEWTAAPADVDQFIIDLQGFQIMEVDRSGSVALDLSNQTIYE